MSHGTNLHRADSDNYYGIDKRKCRAHSSIMTREMSPGAAIAAEIQLAETKVQLNLRHFEKPGARS
jgi:hypothetical protein